MKIALAQLNATVGDFAGNEANILAAYRRGVAAGADVVVCPELAIPGYPPRDLLLKPRFVAANLEVLNRLASATDRTALIVGFVGENKLQPGRQVTNSVALLQHGKIAATRAKTLLPTYDVFDEDRYFEPAAENSPAIFGTTKIALTICEDIWNDEDFWPERRYRRNPPVELAEAGARVIFNISASPWNLGKNRTRYEMLRSLAHKTGRAVVFCNQVGGNDELVFDGGSLVFGAAGELIAQAKLFEEDFVVVDLPVSQISGNALHPAQASVSLAPAPSGGEGRGEGAPINASTSSSSLPLPGDEELIYKALVLGLRDYLHKCGFKSAVLGLSGGIDSAVTACLAVAALGKENVRGISLPSQFSSRHSLDDACLLAARLGIQYDVIPIQNAFESVKAQLQPVFAGRPEDTAEENVQARLRGIMLMALSNKFGSLLLTTGNKSEIAVGYCTLYGDMAGGLAVISDVPKTMIYRLAKWINADATTRGTVELIPASSITKAPSAELRPDQTDQDSLPPYEVLDAVLDLYVVRGKSAVEIAAAGYDAALVSKVIRLIDANEYKRRQAAPGLKVTTKAFGVGRRVPIAQRFREG
jgi:NAD+ synthetase